MKKLLVCLFCLVHIVTYSQKKEEPIVYLNHTAIDLSHVFINPNNIDSVSIKKNTEAGEIHILTKAPIKFITLDSLLVEHTDLNKEQKNILYIIENKVVEDKSKVFIDKSFYIYVKTKLLKNIGYLDKDYKKLIIVDVTLRRKKQFRIRGKKNSIDYLIEHAK